MIHIELWLAVIGLATTLIGFLWKTASIYKDIRYQIKENGKTIVQLQKSFPSTTIQESVAIKYALFDLQQFMRRKYGYKPPPFNIKNNQ